jgi:hypothetical protein
MESANANRPQPNQLLPLVLDFFASWRLCVKRLQVCVSKRQPLLLDGRPAEREFLMAATAADLAVGRSRPGGEVPGITPLAVPHVILSHCQRLHPYLLLHLSDSTIAEHVYSCVTPVKQFRQSKETAQFPLKSVTDAVSCSSKFTDGGAYACHACI